MKRYVEVMRKELRSTLADFFAFIGHSWDLDQERNGMELTDKPDPVRDKTAEDVRLEFSETAYPKFRAASALERGELRSKEGGKNTIHFQR